MKSHELAKKLLEGPDLPVTVSVACSHDTVISTDEEDNPVDLDLTEHDNRISVRGFVHDIRFGYLD